MTVHLTRLEENDWRVWRELRLRALHDAPEAFGSTLAEWEHADEARWRRRLREVPFNVVAEPAGMLSVTEPDSEGQVEIISVWVAPEARGLGVGDRMMEAALERARDQNAAAVVLKVVQDNCHALELYRRHGFTPTGESSLSEANRREVVLRRSQAQQRGPRREDGGFISHGKWFADPYPWLEDLESAETRAFISAQEAVTRAALDSVPGRAERRERVSRAYRHPRRSPPLGGGFFWSGEPDDEKIKLQRQRPGSSTVETVLDPNLWSASEVLRFAVPSPNGRHVAFGKAVGGTHDAAIHILDVQTGRELPDRPFGHEHASVAWRPDGSGFFYTACPRDDAKWNAVHEHRLGASEPARRVFGDDLDPDLWCTVRVTECGRFTVLTKWDFVHANSVFLLGLTDGVLTPVAPELRGVSQVQVAGESVYICTDRDAPRGRLCIAPLSAPSEWRTLIPETADTLQTVTGVGGRLYAVYSVAASHRVRIHAPDGAYLRELSLPGLGSVNRNEGEGIVSGISGTWTGDAVRVSFQSFVQAPSIYRYDFETDVLLPEHVPDVGLDARELGTEQLWFESRDGTRVSMFIVHRTGLPLDGRAPVRLSGYGGFNISVEPRFTAVNAAWLQLGGVLAYVNVRGGGEYGRSWHESATRTRRQNAFDDFIAAARTLVKQGYTTPARLASRGNSNGGLLVAVAAMQEPGAFGAVYCRAPVLDMLRFEHFMHLSSATVEYGSPDDALEGPYLAAYSPYQNIRGDRPYPVMAFAAALNDKTAPPFDPLKMVARLQAEGTRGGPYFLLPLRDSGHAGGTTLAALIEQDTDELSFYAWALEPS